MIILYLGSCSFSQKTSISFEKFDVNNNQYVPKINLLVRFEDGQSVQISSPTSLVVSSDAHVNIQIAEDTIRTIFLLKGESRKSFKMLENIDTTQYSFKISDIFCNSEYVEYTSSLGIRIFTAQEGVSFISISLKKEHAERLCD